MSNTECGPSTDEFNPKLHRKKRRLEGNGRFLYGRQLTNPIPDEVRDTDEIKASFRQFEIVPYAGTIDNSGDAVLDFYYRLSRLSETQLACKHSIKKYSFGGPLDIVKTDYNQFALDQSFEIPLSQKRDFVEQVLNRIEVMGTDLQQLPGKSWEEGHETGNYWLELVLYQVAGVKYARIYHHPTYKCKYALTGKGEQRFVYVSPLWDMTFLEKYPPDVLPLYPAFGEVDGVLRTMIHIKDGGGDWYGKPYSLENPLPAYRQLQDNMYLVKQADNNFTGQVFVEVEDDDPEATNDDAQRNGFESEADRFIENFTNKGQDPQTVIFASRPYGAKPAYIHEFSPNTREDFYEKSYRMSREKIIEMNAWSSRLMDDSAATGLNSGQAFTDTLKRMLPIIQKHQAMGDMGLNYAIKSIIEYFELPAFQGFEIKSQSPYKSMLEQMEVNEQNTTDGNGGD